MLQPLMLKVRRATADLLGCGDCTMLAQWRTASIQKPAKCKLDEKYICCPVTGEMPYDWEEFGREAKYLLVDSEEE